MEIKEKEFDSTYLKGKAVVYIPETDTSKSELDVIKEACKELTATLSDEFKHLNAVYDENEFCVEKKESGNGCRISEITFSYELKMNEDVEKN